MKTFTKQIKKTKVVPDGTKDVTIYETIDGKKYEDKKEAEKHESALIKNNRFKEKYRLKSIELDEYYDIVYVEELNDSTKKEICKYFLNLDRNDLSLGYNFIRSDNCGDYTYIYCYSLDHMISTREKELNKIKDLCA